MLAFWLLLEPFGLLPGIAALTIISSRADGKLSPLGAVVMTAIVAAIATLIFSVALQLPMKILAWPS